MKRILFLLFGCVCAMLNLSAIAQTSQVATLLSGEDVKIYFGPESFKQAVEESKDGDVITLSAGTFDAPAGIDKQLTVRGAGIGLEGVEPYVIPTVINGSCSIKNDFSVEAIRFNSNVYLYGFTYSFSKSFIKGIWFQGDTTITLVQSIIDNSFRTYSSSHAESAIDLTAINSCLTWEYGHKKSHENFINCDITLLPSKSNHEYYNATYTNCVIRSNGEWNVIPDPSNSYYYCLFFGENNGQSFDDIKANGTCFGSNTITEVYKTDGVYELLDEYKALKGSDGKEIGIHGGNLGFDLTPNNPQITRFNVAPKTSADGKLSVEIEVKGTE